MVSMLTPLSVLWSATAIDRRRWIELHDFFIRNSISSTRLLSTKGDDARQSNVVVNFSGPGVAEPARNEKPMPDGGDSLTYIVGAAADLTAVGGAVNGAGEAATGAAGAGAMTAGGDVPLTVTALLARPVLEPSP